MTTPAVQGQVHVPEVHEHCLINFIASEEIFVTTANITLLVSTHHMTYTVYHS